MNQHLYPQTLKTESWSLVTWHSLFSQQELRYFTFTKVEVIYQTGLRVFDHGNKTQKTEVEKQSAVELFLPKVGGVWICDQTQVRVFDTASQINSYSRRKRSGKFG